MSSKINIENITNIFSNFILDLINSGKILSILFVGVGGQGIILSTSILANAVIYEGFDVKVSEVHGMAQRGGSVEGSVRIAKKVFSPTIDKADFLIALEKLEALRYVNKLKSSGIAIINNYEIIPASINFDKKLDYPTKIKEVIKQYSKNTIFINAIEIAKNLKEIRTSNTVLLGVLSNFLPISLDSWQKAISKSVPAKAIDLNKKAFTIGRNLIINFDFNFN